MGFLRHQPDFKIAPDRLCITSQRRHRRRMAGTAASGFQSCHRRSLGVHTLGDFRLRQSRPLPCPEQFVKERELGFQRLVLGSDFWIGECLFLEFLIRQYFWPPSNAAGLLLIHASAFSVFFWRSGAVAAHAFLTMCSKKYARLFPVT